jgi:hypothetical protein
MESAPSQPGLYNQERLPARNCQVDMGLLKGYPSIRFTGYVFSLGEIRYKNDIDAYKSMLITRVLMNTGETVFVPTAKAL